MAHITMAMLPGLDMEKKKDLARKLRALVSDELGVDAMIVSVSVEDIPFDQWNEFMERVPEGTILIPEQQNSDPWKTCKCCC